MFDKIVGNNKIKEYLKNSIQSKNIPHSYMFVGKSGIGKKLFAEEYSKQIMCLNDGLCDTLKAMNLGEGKTSTLEEKESKSHKNSSGNMKNEDTGNITICDSCMKFEAKANPDFIEIFPDGKTLKIDQIRKMQEKIAEKPIVSYRKVYIIDDADLMSEESQNCLLKTLEEPPEYAVIILIVSNESKILATIKSRCVIVKFEKLTDEEIHKIMPNLSKDFIKLLEGSLQGAEEADKKEGQFNELNKIVKTIENGTLTQLFNNAELLYSSKDDIITILEYLNLICFEKRWVKCVEIVEKTKKKILANNNYDMCIDYLLMHMWEEVNK